ncbi:suppressor of fused domain protein [Rheinheimera baltica]|uniref:suppressor of fused domain protein n=1 Tax=Rheinheimera baltica TaxID=67576 RepID=UPI00273F1ECB|nr:suppressor of fused domain protein [Rheinheimera baltica]MDP5142194.1 suppressor of fused domain protein [Rheinheimera baltica]
MQFSKFESALYICISNVMESEAGLSGHEYSDGYRSGHLQVGDDSDPIQVVFSFPRESDDCYLMITDGDPEKLAKEMAALQEYNENEAHLCKGHTVPTDSAYLNDAGWNSYLITTPRFSYADFPLNHEIDGREIRFHLALPLTNMEREIKMKDGLETLLDQFERINRDTITFNQSHNKALHRTSR